MCSDFIFGEFCARSLSCKKINMASSVFHVFPVKTSIFRTFFFDKLFQDSRSWMVCIGGVPKCQKCFFRGVLSPLVRMRKIGSRKLNFPCFPATFEFFRKTAFWSKNEQKWAEMGWKMAKNEKKCSGQRFDLGATGSKIATYKKPRIALLIVSSPVSSIWGFPEVKVQGNINIFHSCEKLLKEWPQNRTLSRP